jgi:predicted glutamine amidotransferase
MCGIVGYVGRDEALPVLLEGMRRLEYRGYDSAGVAVAGEGGLEVAKKAGQIDVLAAALGKRPLPGTLGIGHTRWATHGAPTDANAHPHRDCSGRIAIVHNGIIENHDILRDRLSAEGHEFTSETDTEVVAHLLESILEREEVSLKDAVLEATGVLEGAFALVCIYLDEPDVIVLSKTDRASDLSTVTEEVSALNPQAERVPARFGDVDPAILQRAAKEPVLSTAAAHRSGIRSFVLRFGKRVPKDLLERFLAVLVELRGSDLLRVKGIVALEGGESIAVQGVRHVFDRLRPVSGAETGLVFITRQIERREIEALWEAMSTLKGSQ